jgi:hypothetical protein
MLFRHRRIKNFGGLGIVSLHLFNTNIMKLIILFLKWLFLVTVTPFAVIAMLSLLTCTSYKVMVDGFYAGVGGISSHIVLAVLYAILLCVDPKN